MNGVVVKFDVEKGFGFIRTDDKELKGKDVFVHISQVENQEVLEPSQKVSFDVAFTEKGPSALRVKAGRKKKPFGFFFLLGLFLCASFTIFPIYYFGLPWIYSYLCAVNLTIFSLYGYDKKAAQSDGWPRVPEKVLHLYAFLGGTPCAFLAQHLFHHKTIKGSFRIVFWIIVILQVLIVARILTW